MNNDAREHGGQDAGDGRHWGDFESLRLRTYKRAGYSFLEADGEIDEHTVDRLETALVETCEAAVSAAGDAAAGPTTAAVAVDLRAVNYVCPAAVALLMRVYTRFLDRCGIALIVDKSSQPGRAVQFCRLEICLRVVASPGELETSGGSADAT